MVRRNSLIPLLVLLLTAACGRPQGDHRFISTETARGNGGAFVFEMESEDSAAVFTTTLAARIVASRIPEKTLEFDIHLTPPDGQTSIERHTFPLTEEPGVRISLGAGSTLTFDLAVNRYIDVVSCGSRCHSLVATGQARPDA